MNLLGLNSVFQLHNWKNNLARQTCVETTVALALTHIFDSHPMIMPLMITACVITGLALVSNSLIMHRLARALHRTVIASFLGNTTIHPIIHESGHAFMAHLIYKMPHVNISLNGLGEGATTYLNGGDFTLFGNLIGGEYTQIAIVMGGGLASLAWGVFTPSTWLIYSGMARLLSESYYALSAYHPSGWNPGHDYQFLSVYANISPLAPAAIMLGAFIYRMIEAVAS